MIKYQLILDVAGVILTNLSPGFWNDIAESAGIPYEPITTRFKQEIRDLFWTGNISEDEFWRWINQQSPLIDIHIAQSILFKNLKTLPAYNCIPNWSRFAEIHLLSNHRKEWIEPLLDPIKPYLKSITISSSIGYCKPNPEIYKIVNSKLNTDLIRIYI